MITTHQILIIAKYAIAVLLAIGIFLAPAWIARQTARGKQDMILVRLGSWVFSWTGIGWLWALFWASKK